MGIGPVMQSEVHRFRDDLKSLRNDLWAIGSDDARDAADRLDRVLDVHRDKWLELIQNIDNWRI